jgi:hypothetical protein
MQLYFRASGGGPRLSAGAPNDAAETAANRVADGIDQPGSVLINRPVANTGDQDGSARRLFANRSGAPLSPSLRAFFEPRLGTPLSSVRVHQDKETGDFARRIGARGFAFGGHVGFAPGEYAPDTRTGRRLLAHELAHVALERGAPEPVLRRQEAPPGSDQGPAMTPAGPPMSVSPPLMSLASTPPPASDAASPQTGPTTADASSAAQATSAPPGAPTAGSATIDPTTINARALTNADLIARDVDARDFLARATVSSPETEAWRQLQREIADERTRRISAGFVFLAERAESSPGVLYQMRGGPVSGTIEIVTADVAAAMGPADVSLGGALMSPRQMQAYISTLGYRTISGPTAANIIADRANIIQQAMQADQLRAVRPSFSGGVGRNPFLDVTLSGGFSPYGPGPDPSGRLPIDLTDANFRGRLGEIGMGADYRTAWGLGLQDYNALPWVDVTGRLHTGQSNFPVVDFGPGAGAVPQILEIRPISVTTSGAADFATRRDQYTTKIEALLDVPGRRATAPAGVDLVRQHIVQASADTTLAQGTPAYQQAQSRFLSDTMFAVPDADVAALRNAIAHPNAAPPGGQNRLIARGGGLRDLYAEAIHASPISLTLRNGSTVTCNSLAELAARAPVASRFTVEGSTVSYSPADRISTAEFNRAVSLLGQTAASRIVSISDAPAMAAAADAARAGTGGAPVATPTRILEIDSHDLGYIGQRIGQGLADPRAAGAATGGGMRWTTAAQSDPVLSAVRALTGNPTLQRGTPEFEAARRQALGDAVLAINADDVTAFRGAVLAEGSWDGRLRSSFGAAMADNPVTVPDGAGGTRTFRSPDELDAARASMTPEQYSQARAQAQGLVANRVTSGGMTTAQLNRLETFRDSAVSSLGSEARTVLTPDVISQVRLGSSRATTESFGRGGAGGLIIAVVTTAGTMYIDEREHPDWAFELAVSGGKGFALTGAQSAAESRLTYALAQRAIASGAPLSGWARFGARAGPAAILAGGVELYNISQEEREHSGVEVTTRTGRAIGIAIVSMEIGAAAGSIVPGAGTAVGAVVGFIVGAGVGFLTAYVLDTYVPLGAEDWNERAAAKQAERLRQAEAQRQAMAPKVVGSLGATSTLTPVMSSPDISEEEQTAIARWAALLTIARPAPPGGAPQP